MRYLNITEIPYFRSSNNTLLRYSKTIISLYFRFLCSNKNYKCFFFVVADEA